MKLITTGLLVGLVLAAPAGAAETTTFTYDALGRMTKAAHTGTVNDGLTNAVNYDTADNRSSYVSTNMSISIANATANEGTNLVFTVTRSGSTATAASASWTTQDQQAVAGINYTASSGTVTFAPGVTSATITVPTIDDGSVTPDKTMLIALSAPSAGVRLFGPGTGTIANIDTFGSSTVSLNNVNANEGSSMTFTVHRAGDRTSAASASWATHDGTDSNSTKNAIAGTNYVAASGTVNFPANVADVTITVTTIDDHVRTNNKKMSVTLSAPSSGMTISPGGGQGTVVNID